MHFERRNAFQNVLKKKKKKKIELKKYVCLPYLKFLDPLPETQIYFYLALLSANF